MDNLFDRKVTYLDVVKILLLVVTLFSTWNIVAIMTPDVPFAFIREIAAVGVIEGAFLGFEKATSDAKNRKQVQLATIGFFCSLGVIAIFAGISGFLEFAGDAMLAENIGTWLNITWALRDAVSVFALAVTVSWIVVLASIYRLYSIEDPDKQTELARIEENGKVAKEANTALRKALEKAAPVIATGRAVAAVRNQFSAEMTEGQMTHLMNDVENHLKQHYGEGIASYTPSPSNRQSTHVQTASALPVDHVEEIGNGTDEFTDRIGQSLRENAPLSTVSPLLAYKPNGNGRKPNFP